MPVIGTTHVLFLGSYVLKFTDLVDFKTLQIMYRVRYNLLPVNVQNKFLEKEGAYNLRGPLNFKKHTMRTNLRVMCISSHGVTLWNDLDEDLKHSRNLKQFKYRLKKAIFERYRLEEVVQNM